MAIRLFCFEKLQFLSVPPHQMLLYDKSGADVSGIVGPLEEGSAVVLVCEVRGGEKQLSCLFNNCT